jgi:hypothetical protein
LTYKISEQLRKHRLRLRIVVLIENPEFTPASTKNAAAVAKCTNFERYSLRLNRSSRNGRNFATLRLIGAALEIALLTWRNFATLRLIGCTGNYASCLTQFRDAPPDRLHWKLCFLPDAISRRSA